MKKTLKMAVENEQVEQKDFDDYLKRQLDMEKPAGAKPSSSRKTNKLNPIHEAEKTGSSMLDDLQKDAKIPLKVPMHKRSPVANVIREGRSCRVACHLFSF